MKNVLLVKDGDEIRHFYTLAEMNAAGFSKADKTVTEEEFNSNGCYARIIDNNIVVGRTPEEIAAEEAAEEIAYIDTQLSEIDKTVGPRSVRDLLLYLKDTLPEVPDVLQKAVENIAGKEEEAASLRARRGQLLPKN